MNIDALSDKHLHEQERLARELLYVMRKAKLKDESLTEALRLLETQAGKVRRGRFDETTPQYQGY